MNWNELRAEIDKMSPEKREKEVRFIEPYDKERAGYDVRVVFAEEDLTISGGDDPQHQTEVVFVRKGEPCLL